MHATEPNRNAIPRFSLAQLAIVVAIFGVVFALVAGFIGLVGKAREAARCSQCLGHLTQLALAMHNYHDVEGCFPPAYSMDESGQPLHSWRVLLLPYIEQQATYKALKLDEPWNSPHNTGVAKGSFPQYYQCPSRAANAKAWATDYVVVVGPETMFPGRDSVRLGQIGDDPDQTIMIVETAGSEIHWMEPRDLTLGEAVGGLRSYHPSGVNVALANGRYTTARPRQPKAVFTIQGGEEAVIRK